MCMCLCVYVCICVYVYVRMCVWVYACMCVCVMCARAKTYRCDKTHSCIVVNERDVDVRYGVATVSRIDKIIGLICRISSLL